MEIQDFDKLVFKPNFLTDGTIYVRIDSLGKMFPMTRYQIIASMKKGYHLDKIKTFFTSESISLASEIGAKKTKKTDASEN